MKLTARKFRVTAIAASLLVSIFFADQAFAATNPPVCVAVPGNSYSCVAYSGYAGRDGYGFYNFSSTAADGTLHNCTSYAAYRLYHSNVYNSNIKTLDHAGLWAIEAPVRVPGSKVSSVPHVGDIAQWTDTSIPDKGHVAYVDTVVYHSTGQLWYIVTSDDAWGLQITTVRQRFPGTTTGANKWPDNFITFPGYLNPVLAIATADSTINTTVQAPPLGN